MLQGMTIALSQNGAFDEQLYRSLRAALIESAPKSLTPYFVRTCRDKGALLDHLLNVASGAGSWRDRRAYIYDNFRPLLDHLETPEGAPSDNAISEVLASFDPEGVHRAWQKALTRRHEDPEGAVTAARTLVETVCKRILDEAGEAYGDDDLPKLYGKTARVLNLSPSQHTEEAFRSILGGCYTVVQTLGTLRNRIGDAHGQGRNPVRPAPRHAALAVNLAGTMATFLVETWQSRPLTGG